MLRTSVVCGALAVFAIAPACAKGGQPQNAPNAMTPAAAPATEPLNDAQIRQIVDAISRDEAHQAALAERRANDASTRAYARSMLAAHAEEEGAERGEGGARANTAAPSRLSQHLNDVERRAWQELERASAGDFDRVYLQEQARDHERTIDLVDRELLPQARDPQLRSELEAMRAREVTLLNQALDAERRIVEPAPATNR